MAAGVGRTAAGFGWAAPALLLTGAAVYVTLRSRLALFGALLTILMWFVLVFMGDALLPGAPVNEPLHLVHPFLWLFHPYLTPDQVSPTDYLLNRIAVAALGGVLLVLAGRQLSHSEAMLGTA